MFPNASIFNLSLKHDALKWSIAPALRTVGSAGASRSFPALMQVDTLDKLLAHCGATKRENLWYLIFILICIELISLVFFSEFSHFYSKIVSVTVSLANAKYS